jgi:hypothetical protein
MMTMQNGRFYLPSRNRPKSLERFFQAYRDTGATCLGWVVLNADDWEKNRVAYEALRLPTGCPRPPPSRQNGRFGMPSSLYC